MTVPAQPVANLDQTRQFFPHADRVGDRDGDPPASAVFAGEDLLGYVFETAEVAPIAAYSGKPVNLRMGLDTDGRITGAELLEHHEPILLVGIPEQRLRDFGHSYSGLSAAESVTVGEGAKGSQHVDSITGATVTVTVVNQTILAAARAVGVSRGILEADAYGKGEPATVRTDVYQPADWTALTGNGAIRRLRVSQEQVEEAFAGTEAARPGRRARHGGGNKPFIELYYAYLNAPTIGRNLLGDSQYQWLMGELEKGEHAIAVLGGGKYSFKGSGYVRGGIFDRVQVRQGHREFTFRDLDYYRLSDIFADGAPAFPEKAIFIVRDSQPFDPGSPWSLELRVRRQTGPLDSVFVNFSGDYLIPDAYVKRPEQPLISKPGPDAPLWVQIWYRKRFQIAVLAVGLALLTFILLFQDWLVRRRRLLPLMRNGFLVYSVAFIGWYALAQLSVVNVFTFTHALMTDFKWETFLVDPLMFILWAFVAVSLLLWGRGVFCGWLCPFGAMQELVNTVARRFRVPQIELPFAVHERLWALKYVILLALFAISLQSLNAAERYAEVEPFKTAVILHFQRDWGYVIYAVALLAVSAFNAKFYCRYICPLGAALAVPSRLRLFNWLKRHHQDCGSPCQTCAVDCHVKAIHPDGQINANECHYCLDCQVTYWDEHRCPPMVKRRKRRERQQARTAGAESGFPEIAVPGQPAQARRVVPQSVNGE
ncbi:MAG: 4Fe-4S binding protein [Ectothiorhodospiraceae bacterium]|jgi:NosR/NirI family nitrous oxide reductase transcriptional regulator